ncbi:MAG: hypothetical protein JXN62_14405 [Bacteroidales bacterium]|nr:hypothetical protein [Bacteroidales bacterium]
MKKGSASKLKKGTKFVRIDNYTWIEKKADEPDEIIRQRFLMKMERFLNTPSLRPEF